MYLGFKFCYAAIKATERWAEETEELSENSFNSEESGVMRRKIGCKVIMYAECKEDDKCNDDERNESNEN